MWLRAPIRLSLGCLQGTVFISVAFLKLPYMSGHVGLPAFHLQHPLSLTTEVNNRRGGDVHKMLPLLLRVGCIGLVFLCNAVMWTVFAKALRLSSSSATASVTTTASNFISSAMLGRLLFRETWTPLWWVGLIVTLCGLVLLHTAAPRMTWLPAEKKEA